LADTCDSTNTNPTFNPFPVGNGENCTDYPFLRARVSGGNWQTGSVSAQSGQTVDVVLYIHNGAVEGSDSARNIRLTTGLDLGINSSHNLSASVSADNTSNSLSGFMNIQTPGNARLEVIPGSEQWFQRSTYMGNLSGIVNATTSLPDQAACYEYVRFVFFSVRVVADQPPVTPTGQISASYGGQVAGQCMYTGNINWSTDNAENVQVKVQDVSDGTGEQLFAADESGNRNVDWLSPNHLYRFNLYHTVNGQAQVLSHYDLNVPNLDCGGTQPPAQASGNITGQVLGQVAGQCLFNGQVSWSTQNAEIVEVTVRDPRDGREILHRAEESGTSNFDWMEPSWGYRFSLWHVVNGQRQLLDEVWLNTPAAQNCGGQPQQPQGQVNYFDATLGSRLSGQCLYNGRVRWSTSNYPSVQVFAAESNGANEQLFAADESGDRETPWLSPNKTYRFTLKSNNQTLRETFLSVPNLDCGGTQPPVTPSGSLNVSLGGQVSGQCLFNGFITWSSQNAQSVQVKAKDLTDPQNTPEQLVAADPSGSRTVNWIVPNRTYRFTLYHAGGVLDTKTLQSGNLNCGTNEPPACINRSFNMNNSGYFSSMNSGSRISSIRPNETFYTRCDYGVVTGQITLDGNAPCSFEGWAGTAASFRCTAPNQGGNINISCRLANNATDTNSCPLTNSVGSLATNVDFCPTGSIQVSNSILQVNQTGTVSAPSGWFGGTLVSSDPSIVSISGNTMTAHKAGTVTISGSGFKAPNGLSNCALTSVTVTVQAPVDSLVCQIHTPQVQTNQEASYSVTGGQGTIYWSAPSGNPSSGGNTSNFSTRFSYAGNYIISVTRGTQTVNCPTVVVTQPPINENLRCEIVGSSVVDINQPVNVIAYGGNNTYAFNAPTGNPATRSASTNRNFSTAYSTSGSKTITVISDGETAACPIVTVREPVSNLVCVAQSTSVTQGNPVYFSAQGGAGSFSWSAPAGNPSSGGNSANFSTIYSNAGTYTTTVTRGTQTVACPSVVITPPIVTCVRNSNVSLTHDGIVQVGSTNVYRTTIRYSWTGNNPMRVTYIDPDTNQEVNWIATASNNGSQEFASLQPNKTYLFKIYDTSDCGGLVQTLIVRKDISTQCVLNTNFALNATNPVKNGNVYSVTLNWISSGNHQIKLAQNSQNNIITTGSNTGSVTVNNLSAGSVHTFYMIDADCNVLLTALTVSIAQETPPSGGGDININQCVNNSCNTTITNTTTTTTNTNTYYYINNYGNTVPSNEFRQLSITKQVRSVNGGSYQENVTVNNNDLVEFQITVRNTGNQPVNNVRINDLLPSGLSFSSGSFSGGDYQIGTLLTNESRTVNFQARVNASQGQSLQNVARAYGDNVSQVQDDAWVFVQGSVQGGNVNLTYNKRAWNDTKNQDAQSVYASREDYITYTLTVTNNGNQPATNFVVTDDLSQVMPYVDMIDNGGGSLSGNVITYPGITVPANGSVSRSFKVRVKYHLANNLSYVMTNTYGNTVTVRINQPQVQGEFTAPKTGADSLALAFGAATTGLYAVARRKELLIKAVKLIFS
jgi:uncharacterized repeat protein (TIGR01451 family)